MNMKKLTLASVIMLALTGCGSNGGGSSNSTLNAEVNNNQATQAQVQQQKAEVEALKTQLAQAQANQKQAEDKLKAAEQTQNKDLTEAKKNLASAQENLTQAQSALKQAESQSSANQKTKDELQKQLNQVDQSLSKAQQEKLLAEKELNNKLAQDKTMTRAEVLDFALHNGLWAGDSEEFADNFQNKPKSYVIDQLLDTHKRIAIKRLARSYGLPEADVRAFAKENQNKTLDESTKILESKREEIAQKREALNKEVFELAKSKGLEEWEAHNFAYGRHHSGKEEALKELNKYVTEKAERETKINELINLAKEKGLEDWEARNFANENIDNERTRAQDNLDNLLIKKEQSAILESKRNIIREAYKAPEGFTQKYAPQENTYSNIRGEVNSKETSYVDVYNQKYSIVVGKYENYEYLDNSSNGRETYSVSIQRNYLNGVNTKDIPNEGKATYTGTAFTKDREGKLTYSVDFANKKGKGNITGLDGLGNLTLHEGNLTEIYGGGWGKGISSDMTSDKWKNMKGEYLLLFYGKNAEEIAGVAEFGKENSYYDDEEVKELFKTVPRNVERNLHYSSSDNIAIGFGGTRGEITK